jgi:hypothetical protein
LYRYWPDVGGSRVFEVAPVHDAPDDVFGPAVDGRTQRIPQGTVKYADGRTKTWPRDVIEPIDS